MRGRRAIGLLLVAWLLVLGGRVVRAQDPGLVSIPVDFEINGRVCGQVVLRARADLSEPAVQCATLKSAVGDRLTSAIRELIAGLPDGFVPLDEIRARGLDASLDVERLVIVLKAAEGARERPPSHGTFTMGAQNELHPSQRLPEAAVSAFMNIRLQQTLQADGDAVGRDRPFTADVQSVLNIRGWALSANTLYSTRPSVARSHWSLGDLSLVHDIPERALRWTIGDLSAPIGSLQAGTRMGGVSLSREFTIQPYENFQPTGTAAFQLQEPATVEVFLNGVRMRTLKLEPGSYTMEDFNLAAGANDLVLHITSSSGRFEEINLTQFTARTLLRAGVSEFSYAAGFPMAASEEEAFALGSAPWLRKFYQRDPVFSGFFRRGFTDAFTGELDVQGASYWQRVGAGLDLASAAGAFELHGALNAHEAAKSALSFSAAWERGFHHASLRLSTAYADAQFVQTAPELTVPSRLAWNHAVTVSAPLPRGVDWTASAYYQTLRSAPAAWGGVTRLSRRFGPFIGSLSLQARTSGGRTETTGFVTITWMQPPEWSVRTVLGAGDSALNPGFSTEASYTRRDGSRFYFADAAVESDQEGDHYRGGLRYQDNLLQAELVHRQVYGSVFGQQERSAETVATLEFALASADGAWGVTRHVDDGFAVVTTHRRWRDVTLGIDPVFSGYDHLVKPPMCSAVLGQLHAYRESTSFIQTVDSDQVLDNSDYIFFPSYRRGTRVVIGSDAVYTVRGTLLASDGSVAGYRAIVLSREGVPEVSAFTNIAGRFVAGPLVPGTWRIRCVDSNEWAEIEVSGEATFIRLDMVRLRAPG